MDKMISLLNTVETGHEDIIHNAEMDFYGLRLATCSSDHSVKIFNLENGSQTLVAELTDHVGPVWQIAWAHPMYGNILATCSFDRKVIIWKELDEWTNVYVHAVHDDSVNSISWAPHEIGLILACCSSDGSISILIHNEDNWETHKIPNAHTVGCNSISWCPVIPEYENASSHNGLVKRLASAGCDNIIKIWKEEDDKWIEESRLEAHSDWVRDVAWAPAIGPPRATLASCSQDQRVIIWTSTDYTSWTSTILNVFDDVVWNVCWSHTGGILAVTCEHNKVSMWRENSEGQWICITELNKAKGNSNKMDDQPSS